jgi:hypothetical protein
MTKALANRLATKLQDLVSPRQSTFIKERFIQDNFMLVQQTARLLHQQRRPRVLLKLDITKAFDSVSWPFLLQVPIKAGFWTDLQRHPKWLDGHIHIPSTSEWNSRG